MPPDVSNELPQNLLVNLDPSTPSTTLAFVVPTAKPLLVQFVIKKSHDVSFKIGKTLLTSVEYVVYVDPGV